MARRPDARALLFERIRTSPAKFVHVRGVPYTVAVEESEDPLKIDHVYLNVEVPPFGRLRVAINTLSRASREAGFDPRIRVGIIQSTYTEKPLPSLEECNGLDYAKQDEKHGVKYEIYEQAALTEMLVTKMKVAIRAEIWGELYARDHLGIHQVHCRRASKAVPVDVPNRDGALKLFYPQDNATEAFLFKFDGQA
ncbi:MAG: DUF2278 family protein [Chthoniobacter sp.]|uniref:DUF2278 family protein n=1 Tax=Chthoniobacter sp. TaxID=2510640 RepID=UPI0032A573C8